MAFGQDALEQLSRELLGGLNLNTRLLALIGGEPLDSRRKEEAVAMIQELSGVFRNLVVFLLESGDTGGVVRTSSTITEGSVDQCAQENDKRISREELNPHRKVRGEVVKEEITASPLKDAYQWRKYGQKYIQNREFPRVYYRCMYSHGRGCRAKKQVQQQDNSCSRRPIMYQVTYVNEHTCHQVLPNEPTRASPAKALTDKNTSDTRSYHQHHVVVDSNAESGRLTTVIHGAPSSWPPLLESSQPTDLAPTYMRDDLPLPSQVGMDMDLDLDEILQDWRTLDLEEMLQPLSPVAAQPTSQYCLDDMPLAVTRFPDAASAWPQYYS